MLDELLIEQLIADGRREMLNATQRASTTPPALPPLAEVLSLLRDVLGQELLRAGALIGSSASRERVHPDAPELEGIVEGAMRPFATCTE